MSTTYDSPRPSVVQPRCRNGVFPVVPPLLARQQPFTVAEHGSVFFITERAPLPDLHHDLLALKWQAFVGHRCHRRAGKPRFGRRPGLHQCGADWRYQGRIQHQPCDPSEPVSTCPVRRHTHQIPCVLQAIHLPKRAQVHRIRTKSRGGFSLKYNVASVPDAMQKSKLLLKN